MAVMAVIVRTAWARNADSITRPQLSQRRAERAPFINIDRSAAMTMPLCGWGTRTIEIKVIKDLPWPPPVGQLNTTSPLVEAAEAPPPQPSQPSPGQSSSATACSDQHHQVQFEGVDKCRMSPTKEGKSRPPQRHSSGCLVNTKMSSVEHCGTLG
ncbi:hypothetical protein MHYP_G00121270 [Metynnis hypsauchen]